MRKSLLLAIILVVAAAALGVIPALAQDSDEPKAFAVLFYSPTCPHCHDVINNTIPKLEAQFGSDLEILFVNVATESGAEMIFAACPVLGVEEHCGAVPMMAIGEQALIGSGEIPAQAAKIIDEGLAAGGIPLPPIPGLQEAYDEYKQALAEQEAAESESGEQPADDSQEEEATAPEAEQEADSESDNAAPEASPNPPADQQTEVRDSTTITVSDDEVKSVKDMTVAERIALDPAGNVIAIVVLVGLVACVGMVLVGGFNPVNSQVMQQTTWVAALVTALAGFVMGLTLVAEPGTAMTAMLSMLVTASMLVAALALIGAKQKGRRGKTTFSYPNWLLLVVVIGGMVVAAYLAYVEMSESIAVCGTVGDCNTVQQSDFAHLFGILPIGLFGLFGYGLILAAWLVTQIDDGQLGEWAQVALLGFALFGVLFSIYLTFLEPFVIGATCAWCVTSAIIMALILWLVAADGWEALGQFSGPQGS
jgi:uncharacterized membrane protein